MTQPNFQLGPKCVAFANTGSFGSPTWTALTGISDLKLSPAWEKGEGSTRGSRVKLYAKTMLELGFSGKMRVDHTDTNGYVAFRAALASDTVVDLLFVDGNPADATLTGTLSGWRGECHVVKMDQDQGLSAVLADDFELCMALTGNPKQSVSAAVTAGSPVYTYTPL